MTRAGEGPCCVTLPLVPAQQRAQHAKLAAVDGQALGHGVQAQVQAGIVDLPAQAHARAEAHVRDVQVAPRQSGGGQTPPDSVRASRLCTAQVGRGACVVAGTGQYNRRIVHARPARLAGAAAFSRLSFIPIP